MRLQQFPAFFKKILLFKSLIPLAFILFSGLLYAQINTVNGNAKNLAFKLTQIDSLLEQKAFITAETLITQLKKTAQYRTDTGRLQIDFREAVVLYGLKNPEQSLSLLLINFDKIQDNAMMKEMYANRLGRLFYAAKNYIKTIEYYKIALESVTELQNITGILKYNLGIGAAFFKKKQLDSAKVYYTNVVEYPLNKESSSYISRAYNNLVAIAINQGQYDIATRYSQQSIKIKEQDKDTLGIGFALVNLGNIYYAAKEFKNARESYFKAYKIIEKDSSRQGLRLKRDVLYNLAFAYQDRGKYKEAYSYLLESTDLADVISASDLAENLSEIEAKFNVAQKEKDIEIQKAQNLNTRIVLYGLAVFTLLITVFGFVYYNNYRLKQKSKLATILNETQTKILNATIDAKERERKSIAAILHDSVSALLSSANLHLQASKAQLKEPIPIEIKKAQDIVSEASVKIRDLSHDLISSVLLKFGLAFAVHDLCQKYSNSEIFIHSQDKNIERYDQDFEIKMHSIIEELINNVLKHSKAENATIVLRHRADNKLVIKIIDDGIGFDVAKAKLKDGLGLSHIEARIKMLRGRFIINSELKEGTEISIIVPIEFKEDLNN